jgi:serine/threonine-protein kinase RsbW
METPHRCEFDADKLELKSEVVFPGRVEEVGPIVEGLMGMVAAMKCAEGKEFEIEMALHEALVNAVVHGCKGNPEKKVQCCIACDEERGILIVVRDPGPGFDPHSLPSPLHGENVFASHGRGIYLINQLMDEVSFKRGGTEIHMRKKL